MFLISFFTPLFHGKVLLPVSFFSRLGESLAISSELVGVSEGELVRELLAEEAAGPLINFTYDFGNQPT